MPRISTIQTNFTAGELSPKASGRVDIARYQNAAERLRNVLVNIYGGAERTPGTEMIAPVANEYDRTRLVPFIYNRDISYTLEFGDAYMRVYRSRAGQIIDGGQPYEIPTPYGIDEAWQFRFAQRDDTMFIAHPDFPVYILQRLGETNWRLAPAPVAVAPFAEVGRVMSVSGTLIDASVGAGRTLTVPSAQFIGGDVGRRITSGPGLAVITAFTTSAEVVVRVDSQFESVTLAAGEWTLEDSPQVAIKPSAKGTVGQTITLTATSPDEAWRSDDVGKYVRINRGLVLLTAVTDAQEASGTVKADLDSDVESPPSAWTLESSVWSPELGYPSAVTINQQRLVVGGTKKYPNGVWGSRTGLYYDFTQGDDDTDAFFYALDGESNGIQHLASIRLLLALTSGTEWTLAGGVEKPLTPTNVQAKDQSVYGSSDVRPVRVGSELMFLQRSGRSVLAMSYSVESDSYKSPDLTVLSEHLTRAGVVDMAYQQKPISVIWCVISDGTIATVTIDRDEGVIAWTAQDTQGAFESVCVIPAGDYDEVWVTVRREVQGQVRRYVEKLNQDAQTHSAAFGSDPAGLTVWSGLSHLEGLTVVAKADGSMLGEFVVTSGQITLPRPAKQVQIGLRVTPEIKLLRPEISTQFGTAQASKMRGHEFMALTLDTVGMYINGHVVPCRQFGNDILNRPPAPYSGWKGVGATGWQDGEMECAITQPDPMPFHVLGVVRKWTTND